MDGKDRYALMPLCRPTSLPGVHESKRPDPETVSLEMTEGGEGCGCLAGSLSSASSWLSKERAETKRERR
ncbi:hypothetical protein DPV78_010893 [Talaromyces pinophilus]|nr:hypothetical protein DPV78_010893 [Talaromyces pinophilus]